MKMVNPHGRQRTIGKIDPPSASNGVSISLVRLAETWILLFIIHLFLRGIFRALGALVFPVRFKSERGLVPVCGAIPQLTRTVYMVASAFHERCRDALLLRMKVGDRGSLDNESFVTIS